EGVVERRIGGDAGGIGGAVLVQGRGAPGAVLVLVAHQPAQALEHGFLRTLGLRHGRPAGFAAAPAVPGTVLEDRRGRARSALACEVSDTDRAPARRGAVVALVGERISRILVPVDLLGLLR